MFRLSHADNNHNMLDQMFVLTFWLHWTAQSVDLLLACYVANATCTVIVVVTTVFWSMPKESTHCRSLLECRKMIEVLFHVHSTLPC